MTQEEFSRAFKDSPMRRTKLRGLKRNATVVLENVDTAADIDVPTRALEDDERLVREHVAWALGQIGTARARLPARAREEVGTDAPAREELRSARSAPRRRSSPNA